MIKRDKTTNAQSDKTSQLQQHNEHLAQEAENSFKQQQYGHAAKLYKELAGIYPDKKEYQLAMANSLRLGSKCIEALPVYSQILVNANKNDKVFADAQEGKGLCYIQQGQFDYALNIFKALLAEDATRWKAINAQGVALALSGYDKEAIEYYELALSLDPNNYSILNNLGLTQALTGNTSQAIKTLSHAVKCVDNSGNNKKRIELNLALVYALNGNLLAAEEICRSYLTGEDLEQTVNFYAMLAGNNKTARQYITGVLAD